MPPGDENNEILSSRYNKFSQLTLTSNDMYDHLFLKIAVALKNADNCSMTKKPKKNTEACSFADLTGNFVLC